MSIAGLIINDIEPLISVSRWLITLEKLILWFVHSFPDTQDWYGDLKFHCKMVRRMRHNVTSCVHDIILYFDTDLNINTINSEGGPG
jgi:hypothetical protein